MLSRYEEIFSECCKMTHCKPDNVVFWRPSGPWSIFIRCLDGSEYEYNSVDQSIHTLWQSTDIMLTDDEILVKFGYALGRKMRSRGHDAVSLSAVTGIHCSTIYRYLSGKTQPTYLNLMKICKALNCSFGEFGYIV